MATAAAAAAAISILTFSLFMQLWFPDAMVGAAAVADRSSKGLAALFVFGDSYADTGNHNVQDPSLETPWRPPYGHAWPEHPSGRFSDGRVFTDFYASFLEVRKPVPYRIFNQTKKSHSRHPRSHPRHPRGINFAFGGSGVFPTFGPQFPNISTQIEQLTDLMRRRLVSKRVTKASMALLVISGNDYTAYKQRHPFYEGITGFIATVVEEMGVAVQALHEVGFRRIAVTTLAPLGCLPPFTSLSNFTSCNLLVNDWTTLHNSLLRSRLSSLPRPSITLIDFHSAFQTLILDGSLSLRSCCHGVGEASCGDVDKYGRRLYTLCSSANETFFWDDFHPTNAAWRAISKNLFS